MKIGMVTDSLGHLSFGDMLDTAAATGIQGVEFNACNWTSAPHMNLADLLASAPARADFLAAIEDRSLEVIAFNANGNQLHPTGGVRKSVDLLKAVMPKEAGDYAPQEF